MNRKQRGQIRNWFWDEELTQRQIAREAGVSYQLVCMVLAGTRRNEEVLAVLKEHGFPMELLEQDDGAEAV